MRSLRSQVEGRCNAGTTIKHIFWKEICIVKPYKLQFDFSKDLEKMGVTELMRNGELRSNYFKGVYTSYKLPKEVHQSKLNT